jgi:hypothetical protein
MRGMAGIILGIFGGPNLGSARFDSPHTSFSYPQQIAYDELSQSCKVTITPQCCRRRVWMSFPKC